MRCRLPAVTTSFERREHRRTLPESQAFMRDHRLTEQRNPQSRRIDELDAIGIVDLINAEDRMIAEAVGEERESIAQALELAVAAFRAGGRLVYVGAGTSGRLGVLDAAEMPPTYGTDPAMVRGIIAPLRFYSGGSRSPRLSSISLRFRYQANQLAKTCC